MSNIFDFTDILIPGWHITHENNEVISLGNPIDINYYNNLTVLNIYFYSAYILP